ncbi:EcoAI/FtnUII family type I restriction enzme subunit R [Mycoplasma seminis]|uniref:DEAD/DEAH box helicase family protein n=1 Tax=Mycoplasma seminis TaxID=512749 RepID=A0ABY9HB85_9MOLU|nr:type I restriction endonuclease subunit R [Mycoplasma seminis]WLP85516.1 DEAD/DEAH box helicase family protein [Mycoplasma seminis]
MNQKDLNLSEEDTKRIYITPVLESPSKNWKDSIEMEFPISDGKIITNSETTTRKHPKKADYVLKSKQGQLLAVVEAKAFKYDDSEGIQQAKEYAKKLDVPFCYASSGHGFREVIFDGDTYQERDIELNQFPSREELTQRFLEIKKNIKAENLDFINYKASVSDSNGNKPRYYQRRAINSVLNAIANGQKRILLVMATGTGKTFVAKRIIQAINANKPNTRILFLCDRDALASQTMKSFSSFGNKLIRIVNDKKYGYDTAAEIYVALYQQLTPKDNVNPLLNYKKDFFDYIIIDECHRGSANENSEWRNILEYFDSATQIGLTATPKESEDTSNRLYFGDPIYTYSLKEGIDDGYLAPYMIFQIEMDDVEKAANTVGQVDNNGVLIEQAPSEGQMNRSYFYKERNRTVAREITNYLQKYDPYAKTIVFCKNDQHALDMRDALAEMNAEEMSKANKLSKDYIVRITSNDEEGKKQIENFCDPFEKYPVIATTAELLSTGVDTKTVKLIVLDTEVKSDIKLKQILGRGTRVFIYQNEEMQQEFKDKTNFVIMDFGKSTDLLKNDEFFALPDVIYSAKLSSVNSVISEAFESRDFAPRVKNVVDGEKVYVTNKNVLTLGEDFALTSEKYLELAKERVLNIYPTLEEFNNALLSLDIARKPLFINDLIAKAELNIDLIKDYKNINDNIENFDIIRLISYNVLPKTKQGNIKLIKESKLFNSLNEQQQEVVDKLLDKYLENGINDLISLQTLELDPLSNYGGMKKIIEIFDGRDKYNELINNLLKIII